MTRYFRRIGKLPWREIDKRTYDKREKDALFAVAYGAKSDIKYAQVQDAPPVQVAHVRADSSGRVEVYVDGARTYQTSFMAGNTRSYGCALHRAFQWCEQDGYECDKNVRLEE